MSPWVLRSAAVVLAALACACSGAPGRPDAGAVDAGGVDAGPFESRCALSDGGRPVLGPNDVSMLLPLEANVAAPAALIPRALYDRLIVDERGQPFVIDTFGKLQVVAVRFDLCDRVVPGPCARGDARLRLVLQPNEAGMARDTALHAFYRVAWSEVPGVLDVLQAMQSAPLDAGLRVSPGLKAAPSGAQAVQLAALLAAQAQPSRLTRLTFFSQGDFFAQVRWMLRGVEQVDGGAFEDIAMSGAPDAGGTQHVFLEAFGYSATGLSDVPTGFATVIDGQRFASSSQRAAALATLEEIDDPGRRSLDTLQCVSCHVATPLTALRDAGQGVPERALRGFGWFFDEPIISKRVVNETAAVLGELSAGCR